MQSSAAFVQTAEMLSVSRSLSLSSGGSYSLSDPGVGGSGVRLAVSAEIQTENAVSFVWNNGGTLEAFTAQSKSLFANSPSTDPTDQSVPKSNAFE